MAPPPRETAGTTVRLVVQYVRHHAGDEGVARLLWLAGETRPIEVLEDEQRWSTYEQKIALFDAACLVLDDRDAILHVGETALDHQVGPGIRILIRRLGSPRLVLANVAKACPKFSTVATMRVEELAKEHAVITYRLDDGKVPHRGDCQLNIGLMRTIGPIFGMPLLDVEHPDCQVLGAPECRYVVRWTSKRRLGRAGARREAALRHQIEALGAQIELLQSTTADLVSSDDVDDVLSRIVTRAGRAVSAPSYLLALYDTVDVTTSVHADGIAPDRVDAATAEVLECEPGASDQRIVIEVASSQRAYGRLAAFSDGPGFFPFESRLLAAYARSAAAALDAATALDAARRRSTTNGALFGLARALAEPSAPRRIARIVAGAMIEILHVPSTAVLLWNAERTALRVAGRSGWPPAAVPLADQFALNADVLSRLPGVSSGQQASVIPVAAMLGTELGDELGTELANHDVETVAIAPIRAHHGELFGLAVAAVGAIGPARVEALTERLAAIGDQAAVALQNAQLLEQIRHQAVHDGLTGLANRALFDEELDKALARARRDGSPLSVLFIDLDDFKSVNDRFGHGVGDHVLRTVAARLLDAGRKGDSVARLGGDEFVMLLAGSARADSEVVATRTLAALREPIPVGGSEIRMHASIGIASAPEDGDDREAVMRAADRSMYVTKHGNRGAVEVTAPPGAESATV